MFGQTKFNKSFRLWLMICLLLLVGSVIVKAQSGRRVKNPPPVKEETQPEPTSSPTPKPKEEIKPEYSIIVVSNNSTSMNSMSFHPENMYGWVLERLRSSSLLEVRYGGDSSNKKATEMAKNSENSYVLLVELSEDRFASPTIGNSTVSQGQVWIDFSLFSPTTGKVKLRGRAELRPELLRGSILSRGRRVCFPLMTDNDYLLLEASYEVAERTMNGFNLLVSPVKCNKMF